MELLGKKIYKCSTLQNKVFFRVDVPIHTSTPIAI